MRIVRMRRVGVVLISAASMSCAIIACIHWYHVQNLFPSPMDNFWGDRLKTLYKFQQWVRQYEDMKCKLLQIKIIIYSVMIQLSI